MRAMQRVTATFLLDDGRQATAGPGDVVGRLVGAAVHLNDPRISEMHAYVSLRGARLVLIALRGPLAVDGIGATEVALEPGVEVALGAERTLVVARVDVPERVLGVQVDEGPEQPILGDVASLRADGTVEGGFDPDAAVRLWSTGQGWFVDDGPEPRALPHDETLQVGSHRVRLAEVSVRAAAASPTQGRATWPPLHLVTSFDAVSLTHLGAEPVLISGLPARLLSELVAMGGTARWDTVASELWSDAPEASVLRTRWDKTLAALRRHLRRGDIRPSLVQTSAGIIQLSLLPQDTIAAEE